MFVGRLIDLDHIEFEVECPNGHTITMTGVASDQILSVKKYVLTDAKVKDDIKDYLSPSGSLELSYAGNLLEDISTLRDYGIGIGSILYVEHYSIRSQSPDHKYPQ